MRVLWVLCGVVIVLFEFCFSFFGCFYLCLGGLVSDLLLFVVLFCDGCLWLWFCGSAC